MKWVVLAGLSSKEIASEVLGTVDIDQKSLSDTILVVESKERAARAYTSETVVTAASTYKKEKKVVTIDCKECGKTTPKFGRNRKGKVVEYKMCTECFRNKRAGQTLSSSKNEKAEKNAAGVTVWSVQGAWGSTQQVIPVCKKQVAVDNLVFDDYAGWQSKEL